jgi:DNA-binding GntR family transcriptional regulator
MASQVKAASGRKSAGTTRRKPPAGKRSAKAAAKGATASTRIELSTRPDEAAGRVPKLTQVAYEKILGAIVDGRLDLGEPLSENDLARALKLSKAPIRESLGELRLKGLVVVVPQSGTYVFCPTADQIGQLCDFRVLLETRALRESMECNAAGAIAGMRQVFRKMKDAHRQNDLATVKRLDTEFHLTMIRHSGNSYLIQAYEHISHTIEALRYRFMDTAIYRNKAHHEHEQIIALLAANQIAKAISVLEEHIARTKRMHSSATWGTGRLRRKDYRFRDYSEVFS